MRHAILTISIVAISALAQAKVIALTKASMNDYGDPSRPQFVNGGVTVTATGGFLLTWKKEKDFFAGREPKSELLKVCHADGTMLSLDDGEDIWDPTLEDEVLIGSVMIPTAGKQNAHWPEDAVSRRTFAFRKINDCWTRDKKPLWPSNSGWIGHTYGHDTLEGVLFYEKVTKVKDGRPQATDLFARQNGKEISIFRSAKWPSSRREDGSFLVEGARPFKIASTYYIAFSAGDYFSASYGIHLLKSKSVTGPYEPILNDRKTDLKDFSSLIESEIELTWGAGRAAFFERNNKWWVIAHGIPAPFNETDGHRQLFLKQVDPDDLH